MRRILASALVLVASLTVVHAGAKGNGAPSGSHYNLNIIGVGNPKKASMDSTNRHVIFVPLTGGCQINLVVGPFGVADGNCFDGDGAQFTLPNPDSTNSGTTEYSVFARALGKPGGSSMTKTCGVDPSDGSTICSVITLELTRETGQSQFKNASKYLLYVYADVDGDGDLDRMPLFDSRLQDYFWQYDNNGLRLAQLRFYPCSTVVPEATDPLGPQDDSDCF